MVLTYMMADPGEEMELVTVNSIRTVSREGNCMSTIANLWGKLTTTYTTIDS